MAKEYYIYVDGVKVATIDSTPVEDGYSLNV